MKGWSTTFRGAGVLELKFVPVETERMLCLASWLGLGCEETVHRRFARHLKRARRTRSVIRKRSAQALTETSCRRRRGEHTNERTNERTTNEQKSDTMQRSAQWSSRDRRHLLARARIERGERRETTTDQYTVVLFVLATRGDERDVRGKGKSLRFVWLLLGKLELCYL